MAWGAASQVNTDVPADPAAWWFKCDEYESVTLLKEHADAMAEPYGTTPVPLYQAPTFTQSERDTIQGAIDDIGLYADEMGLSSAEAIEKQTALRAILSRMK